MPTAVIRAVIIGARFRRQGRVRIWQTSKGRDFRMCAIQAPCVETAFVAHGSPQLGSALFELRTRLGKGLSGCGAKVQQHRRTEPSTSFVIVIVISKQRHYYCPTIGLSGAPSRHTRRRSNGHVDVDAIRDATAAHLTLQYHGLMRKPAHQPRLHGMHRQKVVKSK